MAQRLFMLFLTMLVCMSCEHNGEVPLSIAILNWNQGYLNGGKIHSDTTVLSYEDVSVLLNVITDDFRCDVCFFTEYLSELEGRRNKIQENLFPKEYKYRYNLNAEFRNMCIVSKYPFTVYAETLDSGYRYLRGIISVGKHNIDYALLHLSPGLNSVERHGERVKDISNIIEYYNAASKVIIVGDFNTPKVFVEEELGLFLDAGYDVANGGYNDIIPTWESDPNDNIIVKGLKLQDFQVGTDNGYSDHKTCRANIVLDNIQVN